MNYRVVLYTLGWVMNFEAGCLLFPAVCAFIYGEKSIWAFLITCLICLTMGLSLTIRQPKNRAMYAKEGFIIVAFSWIVMSVLGALPFLFSGAITSFTDALFETVSGFTTTGASILSDIEILPKSVIFWRSFTHWIGGMGVIVLLVALLPLFGGSNLYLIKAESPGPSVNKLVPRVKTTAKILYSVYISLTFVQIIILLAGGMDAFSAITLSFGTAGTGGFGVLNSGAAEYSSFVQNTITVFMLIFGVDFTFYYLILMRKFKNAICMEEVRAYFIIVLTSILLICINCRHLFGSIWEGLKHAAFQVASIMTTTGYSTCDFNLWPTFSKTILVLLMFIGACAGSTGGGMKVSRIIILAKSIVKEIKMAAHPKSMYKTYFNSRTVAHETVRSINVFTAAYFLLYAASLLIISLDNFDFTTNFTAVAATINNIGPGLELVGPTQNFSLFSPISKLILTFDMLVGRLEIFPVLMLFSPYTWKK